MYKEKKHCMICMETKSTNDKRVESMIHVLIKCTLNKCSYLAASFIESTSVTTLLITQQKYSDDENSKILVA